MSDKPSKNFDLDAFEKATATAVNKAQSLEEIEAWLKSQPFVKSVHLTNYLLKSNPPQRDFVVMLQTSDDTMITKIVNVFDLGNKNFRFNKLRQE